MDVYNFGELILEVLTNGRVANASGITENTQRENLIREVADDNGIVPSDSLQEDVKSVIEVALLCTRSRPSDRPSMQDALKLLPGLKSPTNAGPHKA